MSVAAILLPAFVQAALTFGLLLWMGRSRFAAVGRGEVTVRDGAPIWPGRVKQAGDAFHNQLELPPYFLILVGLALVTRKADLLFVVMSWAFVLSRVVHAGIHVTTNVIRQRFAVFLVGATILMLMWIIFAARILFAGAGPA